MQRTPRQAPMVANRDKSQPWSGIPKRESFTLNELEVRVCAAERTNRQILNDIAEIRQGLNIENRSIAGFCDTGDSDVSVVQDFTNLKNQSRNTRVSHAAEVQQPSNLSKVLQKLTTDVQDVHTRCGTQATDIQKIYRELKNLDSKLENIMSSELRAMQKEAQVNPTRPKTPKFPVLERLEASVAQIESNMKQTHSDRLRFENNVHNSLMDQTVRTGEIEKFTKESIAELRSLLRDNAQEIISMRQGIRSELDNISYQLNQRVAIALEKVHDELTNYRTDIEAALGRFSVANSGYESRLVEIEEGYKKVTRGLPVELHEIREEQQVHQKKLLNSLAQLDLAVEGLEQGLSDEKEQLKGVVAAEIKSRTSSIYMMQAKLQELEDFVKQTSSKVDSSIKEIEDRIGRHPDQGVQTSLRNIAEAIQAVKVGLLAKVEKLEKETNEVVEQLSDGIKDLKGKIESAENDKKLVEQTSSE